MKLSILMSVYVKEVPAFLYLALQSVLNQTLPPSEIVLVKDGPLTQELNDIIDKYCVDHENLFKIINLPKNVGLGPALNEGLKHCTFDLVARMDSDDISVPERFEIQTKFLREHPQIVAVGSYLEEFNSVPGDLKRIKTAPLTPKDVIVYARKRNPVNHPSVMFRRDIIRKIGGYESMLYFEDYFLWLKLLNAGYKLGNIERALVQFRIGNDMIGRRHGSAYAKSELYFAKQANVRKLLSSKDTIRFIATRIPLRLIPKNLLRTFYKNVMRR